MTGQENNNRHISFEFFPTKTAEGAAKLEQTALQLAEYKPAFFSVTYGAGGSTRDRTLDTVLAMQEQTKVVTAPHLSCVGDTRRACWLCCLIISLAELTE